jgi:hypothetical protein
LFCDKTYMVGRRISVKQKLSRSPTYKWRNYTLLCDIISS